MYFIGTQNPRTIITIAALFFGFALMARAWIATQPKIVNEHYTTARVVAVKKNSTQYKGRTGVENTMTVVIGKLALENGKMFNASLVKPYPNAGDTVDVKVVEYSDGSISATPVR